jgi:hypothetical protein
MIPIVLLFMFLLWFIFTEGECGRTHFIYKILNLITSIIISWMILDFVDDDNINLYREHKIVNIISAKNSQEVSGSFVLGSGSIKEIEYYYYYFNTNSGYKRDKIKVSNTYVKEHNLKTAFIVGLEEISISRFGIFTNEYHENNHYEKNIIYVPKNSIIREFKIF